MKRAARALLLVAALAPALAGCAARERFLERVRAERGAPPVASSEQSAALGDGATLTTLTALPPPTGAASGTAATPPPAMQFLYGSGEAAALSYQAYFGLANYIISMASERAVGHDLRSVVIARGATLDQPTFEPCGDKPLAVILDIDETTALNLGFEADAATGVPYDQARWTAWEKTGGADVAPVPGALDMAQAAKAEKVTLVFNSNRSYAAADATAAMLAGIGLGPVARFDTLWLQGDANSTGGGKDARRWAIAKKYCVIAMAGDQLGDFSDLFNAAGQGFDQRRASVGGRYTSVLWGHGWFMLPNPVYGTALKGTMDEVFPHDKRWPPPPPASATAPPAAGAPTIEEK